MLDTVHLNEIIKTLEEGGLILLPTDTIWGISCDATRPEAIEKIYTLKQRAKDNPFILLVDSIKMLKQYTLRIHPRIETLLGYHKRPLTVIYDKGTNLPSITLANNESVAIRIVQDELCRQIIQTFGKPIVSTSANISKEPFPNNFGEVSSKIIQGVDYVVPYRQLEKSLNRPSVIVRLNQQEELDFIRE